MTGYSVAQLAIVQMQQCHVATLKVFKMLITFLLFHICDYLSVPMTGIVMELLRDVSC